MTRTRLFAAITTLLMTTPLWATNGYFTHGIGAKNKGMAGAGLAMPEDAISVANNPAAALANAGKFDLGLALFAPMRSYETGPSMANGMGGAFTIGPNSIDSENEMFFIPHMAGAWAIDEKSAWSFAFYGRGGMNTRWEGGTATFDPDGQGPWPVMPLPGTYGGGLTTEKNGTAGVDLSQAFLELGYARQAGENFTWGASLVGVIQVFAARGVGAVGPYTESFANTGVFPAPNLSDNGHDQSYGIGAKFGFQWDLNEKFSLAASYQTEINMSEFDDYADLFAEHGDFDIPQDLKLGLTFRPNESLALSLDYEKIWYGDIDSIANPVRNVYACVAGDSTSCFGGANGGGFGWQDMDVIKLGAQWDTGNGMVWRAGYSHGDQPIPDNEVMFNILAPATIEDHITVGFTRGLSSGNEWTLSFMYAPNNKVSGPATFTDPMTSANPFDPTQTIDIDMDQWELEFSFGWR
jgi:long-chain fatty acid transport protein